MLKKANYKDSSTYIHLRGIWESWKVLIQLLWPIVLLIFSSITFYLTESLYGRYLEIPFSSLSNSVQRINIVFYVLIALVLFSIIGKLHWALILHTLIFAILGMAQMYVLRFRSVPITPFDLLTLQTAMNVADNYDYTLDVSTRHTLLLLIVTFCFEFICRADFSSTKKRWLKRGLGTICFVLVLLGYGSFVTKAEFCTSIGLDKIGFRSDWVLYSQGVAYNFAIGLDSVFVDVPLDYRASEEENILAAYINEKEESNNPNIIVIMNEAFSDLSILGDFESTKNYMPFMNKILDGQIENTVSGYLDVSVRGGLTCNTEFEFLTGNTCGFLPQGSVPFQFYVHEDTESLASYLDEQGYQTIGMHPYSGNGWNRLTVYPQIGFTESYFLEDFTNTAEDDYSDPKKIRQYISDEADYSKLVSVYEEKYTEDPIFIFNVTMQNHGGYNKKCSNFTPDLKVDGINSFDVETYLSLIRRSDCAIEDLISYFSDKEEEVIVVFFGDHQPGDAVTEPILNLNGRSAVDLDGAERRKLYQVPFFIWANYDIAEETDVEMSVNYLAAKLLETAEMKMSPYFSFLADYEKQYPVVTANYAFDNTGKYLTTDLYEYYLGDYARMQYYVFHE